MPNINKVVYGNTTLLDLTGTTATADKIMVGYGAYGRDGSWMDGTATGGADDGYVYQDNNGYVVLDDQDGVGVDVIPLNVTANGTYTASTRNAYNPVTVNVQGVDLSQDTVESAVLLSGYTAHDSSGDAITGTYRVQTTKEVTLTSSPASITPDYYDYYNPESNPVYKTSNSTTAYNTITVPSGSTSGSVQQSGGTAGLSYYSLNPDRATGNRYFLVDCEVYDANNTLISSGHFEQVKACANTIYFDYAIGEGDYEASFYINTYNSYDGVTCTVAKSFDRIYKIRVEAYQVVQKQYDAMEEVYATFSSGGGVNAPTFTEIWDNNWENVLSVTCDKTYAQCLSYYDNDYISYALLIQTDQMHTEEYISSVTVIGVYPDHISYVDTAGSAQPFADINFYNNGEIDYVYPSTRLTTLNVTSNGTYTPSYNESYATVNVNVSGGGTTVVEEKDVNFYDYDGTLLHSYTANEFAQLTSLPANPSHSGLTAQGWNWTKAEITSQLSNVGGVVNVGQMYITQSGDTEIDVYFADSTRLSPIMTICVNGTVTVDWGDNTTPDTVTGTSLTTRLGVPHTYANDGYYTIVIHVVSGSFSFYNSQSYPLLRKNMTTTVYYENVVYTNTIQRIRLGNNITSIGSCAFQYCYSLLSITVPSSITSIESNAFNCCYSLSGTTIPSNITSIESSAFISCRSLLSIAMPSSITSIGNNAFSGCYSLSSITMPSNVTSIGSTAFQYCYSLSSIAMSSNVTSIGSNAFNSCQSLLSITVLGNITSIAAQTFSGCNSLSSITIPSNVTSIGNTAFSNCHSLSSVTIPSSITSIGTQTFNNCYGMAEYHLLPTTPPTLGGTNAFTNIPSDCKIYVPAASLEAYQTATNWSTYASYMVGE